MKKRRSETLHIATFQTRMEHRSATLPRHQCCSIASQEYALSDPDSSNTKRAISASGNKSRNVGANVRNIREHQAVKEQASPHSSTSTTLDRRPSPRSGLARHEGMRTH